jgi:hypothetical protein
MHIPVSWKRLSRLKKTVVIGIWSVGMASLLYSGYLYLEYGDRMPSIPQPTTGRITPFNFKGRTVYVTKTEESRYTAAQLVLIVSWVAFAFAVLSWGRGSARRSA